LFVCGAALQRSIAKKATLRCSACFVVLQRSGAKKGNGSVAAVAFFFFFFFMQRKKSPRLAKHCHPSQYQLLCLAHGGGPDYVALTSYSNKVLLLKGLLKSMVTLLALSIEFP
jgi:hypothetical protein